MYAVLMNAEALSPEANQDIGIDHVQRKIVHECADDLGLHGLKTT
jgi:hypothetical protein